MEGRHDKSQKLSGLNAIKNTPYSPDGTFSPDYSQIFPIEPRIEYFRSFSVVPPSEAFASLFLYAVFDYRQKKPLKYSILGSCCRFYE